MAFSYGNYATPGAINSGTSAYTGLTSGNVFNGNTPADQNSLSNGDIKAWFANNPNATPTDIANAASQYHMTPGGVAQAISIGTGAAYDPGAVRNWLGSQNTYSTTGGTGGVGGDGVITGGPNGSANLGFGGGPGSSGGSGSGGYGGGGSSGSGYPINPYLDQQAQGITQQVTDNYNRNIAPQNRSGAMAAGGFGGSRQGVVDANSLNDMNRSLGANLANLYGTGWQNAQQNGLQNKSIDSQYALGMANNNLGYSQLDSNNAQFGANLALNTANAQNNWATNGVAAATNMYTTPSAYLNQFLTNTNNIAGQGGTATNTTQMPGNTALGVIGGVKLANSLIS